jgi:UDP-N-acetylglucosamine--N-acetylmuramyl-(pentapeptide) pyrophosphoryl-undecaprenol N-acetylglucosamine transferase
MKKIVFTGGGTAGHIIPNLALIDDLKNYKIYYLGSNGMEKKIISQYKNIEFIEIPAVKFNRSITLKNLLIPFKLISSIKQCKKIFKNIKPDLIFSKGGYVSIPPCFAGFSLNIPVITHESDISLGLANKLIGKKAKYICCSFKSTADKIKKNAVFTGSPIRKKILNGNKTKTKEYIDISKNKPTILIVGGSQGAKAINNIIWKNIDKLTNKYNIIHIVGNNNINKQIKIKDYFQIEFANNIEDYFDLSDIVISRAGSNTIFELLAINKPMILIPLPKTSQSRGDQVDNAIYFKNNNYANVIFQENLTIELLLETISLSLKNKHTYKNTTINTQNNIGNHKIIELIEKTI